jgi:hypothetical protein
MVIPPKAGIWSRNQNRNSNNVGIRRNLTLINFAQGKTHEDSRGTKGERTKHE